MAKRRALYIIAFMLMVTALLMIVANNVPLLASFRWLWAPGFLLFALLFNFDVFKSKGVLAALAYGLLYVGILQYTLWNHASGWYKEAIFEDFYAMIVFVLLFALLRYKGHQQMWVKLAKLGVLFMVFTGIMTIIATEINPMVVRASYSSGFLEMKNYEFLYSLGFGSYGYMAAVVAFLPVLVYFLRKKNNVWLPKYMLIFLILFFFFILFKAQIFANILVGSAVLVFSFMGRRRLRKSIFFIVMGVVLFAITPNRVYVSLFNNVAGYFERTSLVHEKFTDMAVFIQDPVVEENSSETQAGSRASRYPALWKAFVAAPLLGDASYNSSYDYEMGTGGHLYWMSRLALWGVLGFLGYLFILRNIFKPVLSIFDEEFRFYYYLSISAIVALGLLKNLGGREPYIMLLIIIPGLYLLKLNKENR